MFILVVQDLVPALVGRAGKPGLDEHVPVWDLLARVIGILRADDVGGRG